MGARAPTPRPAPPPEALLLSVSPRSREPPPQFAPSSPAGRARGLWWPSRSFSPACVGPQKRRTAQPLSEACGAGPADGDPVVSGPPGVACRGHGSGCPPRPACRHMELAQAALMDTCYQMCRQMEAG